MLPPIAGLEEYPGQPGEPGESLTGTFASHRRNPPKRADRARTPGAIVSAMKSSTWMRRRDIALLTTQRISRSTEARHRSRP